MIIKDPVTCYLSGGDWINNACYIAEEPEPKPEPKTSIDHWGKLEQGILEIIRAARGGE